MEETKTDPEEIPPAGHRYRFNPWLFFGVLLAPGIISFTVFAFHSRDYGNAAIITWIAVSIVAGLICGVHFTLSLSSLETPLKIVIGIVSVIVCAGAAAFLGMAGCGVLFKIF